MLLLVSCMIYSFSKPLLSLFPQINVCLFKTKNPPCRKLKKLSVAHNKLNEIPGSLCQITSLYWLNVKGNSIQHLGGNVRLWSRLQVRVDLVMIYDQCVHVFFLRRSVVIYLKCMWDPIRIQAVLLSMPPHA